MKKLLILLFPTLLFANQTAYNHTHLGVGYSGETQSVSNIYNQNDITLSPTKRHHISFTTMNNFAIENGNVVSSNGMYRLGYDNIFSYTSTLFVFNQTFMNPVDDVRLRNDAGFGAKTTLVKKQVFIFDVSAAPVFTYTKYLDYHVIKGGASFRAKAIINPTDEDSISLVHFYIIGGDYRSFNNSQVSYYHQFTENLFSGIDCLATHESVADKWYYNLNVAAGIKL